MPRLSTPGWKTRHPQARSAPASGLSPTPWFQSCSRHLAVAVPRVSPTCRAESGSRLAPPTPTHQDRPDRRRPSRARRWASSSRTGTPESWSAPVCSGLQSSALSNRNRCRPPTTGHLLKPRHPQRRERHTSDRHHLDQLRAAMSVRGGHRRLPLLTIPIQLSPPQPAGAARPRRMDPDRVPPHRL